ncbi:hypothetical protein [Mitsuaria sp. 7]|uniref:hypothetical protein n=1 Tax=Mitsuaria sp. 7 TaxID=1658665 RepID=UPI0007DD411D|nr:hypothetical protein [Mitsuaria sp. 7]ANH66664.1 hypothetical protein ABE85_02150 [Mitsuaria sp. 7]
MSAESGFWNHPVVIALQRLAHEAVHHGVPGLLVSGLLIGLSMAGVPAAKSAVYDLWTHAWKVHPFILASAGFLTTTAVLLQGADISPDLDSWLFAPVLGFLAHILCFSSVTLSLLWFSYGEPWVGTPCQDVASLIVLTGAFLTLALMATGGSIIVQDRIAERKDEHAPRAEVSSKWTLRLYVPLSVGCFAACVVTATSGEKTDLLVRSHLNTLSVRFCAGYPVTSTLPSTPSSGKGTSH